MAYIPLIRIGHNPGSFAKCHFEKCGEHYGRYDETGRNPGSFAKCLQECGIDAQYSMPDEHNIMGLQRVGITHFLI